MKVPIWRTLHKQKITTDVIIFCLYTVSGSGFQSETQIFLGLGLGLGLDQATFATLSDSRAVIRPCKTSIIKRA